MQILPPVLVIAMLAAAALPAAATEKTPAAALPDTAQSEGRSSARAVQCSPVATVWPASSNGRSRLAGPQLSVVRTDVRPKDVRLYLDDRFIGRARYFNGKKGYLFLEPGRYRLELRFGGYRTDVFEIDARPNCRFDIKLRMERDRGSRKEGRGDPPGRGVPSERVYGPITSGAPAAAERRTAGPDLSLRPDVAKDREKPPAPRSRDASLRLTVRPVTASVLLDGEFIATGAELESMVNPLAIPAGQHVLEVRAPGYSARKIAFEVSDGEVKELEVVLQR